MIPLAAPEPTRKPCLLPSLSHQRLSLGGAWKSVFLPNLSTGVCLCKLPQETLCFLSKNTEKKKKKHLHGTPICTEIQYIQLEIASA